MHIQTRGRPNTPLPCTALMMAAPDGGSDGSPMACQMLPQARETARKQWAQMHNHARERYMAAHHNFEHKHLRWVYEHGDWDRHEAEAQAGLTQQWRMRLVDSLREVHPDESEHLSALVASLHSLGNMQQVHPEHLRRMHAATSHRATDVKAAAIDVLKLWAHPSSEPVLLQLVVTERDAPLRVAALKALAGYGSLERVTIAALLDKWATRAHRGHTHEGCIRACVRSICHPLAHKHQCHKTCKQSCLDEHKVHNELHTLLRRHVPQHARRGGPAATSSSLAVVPIGGATRGRGLMFDWLGMTEAQFDLLSLTFVKMDLQFPGKIDETKNMGMEVAKIAFFGFKLKILIDNSAWLELVWRPYSATPSPIPSPSLYPLA